MKKYYEVLWYNNQDDYDTKEFRSKKEALNYYEQHKNDADKINWWVTQRDEYGCVVEDIIY